IYAPPAESWDDSWELVVADGLPGRCREVLRKELHWEGFGGISAGVYARPAQAGNSVPLAIAPHRGGIITVRPTDDASLEGSSLAAAVPRAWDLAAIAGDYRRFLRR